MNDSLKPSRRPSLAPEADLLKRLWAEDPSDHLWVLPSCLLPAEAVGPDEDRLRGLNRMNGQGGRPQVAQARAVRSRVLPGLGLEMCRLLTWRDEEGEHWAVEPGIHAASSPEEVAQARAKLKVLFGEGEARTREEALVRWGRLPGADLLWD